MTLIDWIPHLYSGPARLQRPLNLRHIILRYQLDYHPFNSILVYEQKQLILLMHEIVLAYRIRSHRVVTFYFCDIRSSIAYKGEQSHDIRIQHLKFSSRLRARLPVKEEPFQAVTNLQRRQTSSSANLTIISEAQSPFTWLVAILSSRFIFAISHGSAYTLSQPKDINIVNSDQRSQYFHDYTTMEKSLVFIHHSNMKGSRNATVGISILHVVCSPLEEDREPCQAGHQPAVNAPKIEDFISQF